MAGTDGFAGFVHRELHAVELAQQIVGKLDVGLVALIDQQYRALLVDEGLPQGAGTDVIAHVVTPLLAQLRVADRKSVVRGKSVSVRVDLGGRRIIKK